MSLLSRADQSYLGQWWWTVDRTVLGCVLALMVMGVMLVATASPPVAQRIGLDGFYFLTRHILFLVPAIAIMLTVSFLQPKQIWRLCTAICVLALLAMIVVLFTGSEVKGAQRWISLFGFSLQPSEFLKPGFAVVSAWLMSLQQNDQKFPGNVAAAILYGLCALLLMLQPDLGMTVVVTCILGVQIFLAGFPFRFLFALMGAGIAALLGAYFAFSHVQSRIDRFLDPESGDNYQVQKSIESFQAGGALGVGPGQGNVKLSLPDAHSDFIFSVAGEEFGLVLVLILIAFFAFILSRVFNKLMDQKDMFVVLAVGGLLAMLGVQTLIHMGSALNVLPAKGMTLPLVSYGGSSLISAALSFGIILALTRMQIKTGVSKSGLSLQRPSN